MPALTAGRTVAGGTVGDPPRAPSRHPGLGPAVGISAVSLALFTLATVGVGLGWGARLDRRAFVAFIAGSDDDRLARLLELVAQLVSPLATAVILTALGIAVLARRVPLRLLLTTVLILAVVTAVELALKEWLTHSGPPAVYHHQLQTLTILYANSFPSGHAARSLVMGTAVVMAVSPRPRPAVVVAVAILVGLIMLSRLYLGEHWVSDVAGGVLLGIAAVPWLVVAARWRRSGVGETAPG